ncbi:MAG: hypothetical protein VX619_11380 [bacterium]|nr:hypothetical protein [bacterium]
MSAMLDEVALESSFRFEPILDLTEKNFLIKGRYRILKLYFETTRTNIFLGVDVKLRRQVFVHVVKNQFFQRGKELKSWIQSIRTTKKIKAGVHHFEILDMDLWKKKFFIVTDHFEGVPLFNLLISKMELPLEFILKVLENICDLMLLARDQGLGQHLVSREDFFIGRDGSIHLLRFTPPRFKLDASSEEGAIYFLGSLLYELLSSEKPFKGRRDTVEMEHAHLEAVLKVRSNQTQSNIFNQICELFVRSASSAVENKINNLELWRDFVQRLGIQAQKLQEDYDQKIEKEQLNSAFDVVYALKGEPEELTKKEEVIPQDKFSRVWYGLESGSKVSNFEMWFRWIAVTTIIISFLYKFYWS